MSAPTSATSDSTLGSSPSAIPPRLAAALADRYLLERELGRGGMATVYLAQDLRHTRSVALKVLHPELAQALGPERFLREIQIAARLQHAHILPLFDSGTADGLPYYAMPYIEGESLRARMTRERQLDLTDALRISREIAAALGHAHAQGIVHRDIKPENILLTREGSVLVADFGIARAAAAAGVEKLTETGLSLGTPAYMSPEQAAGTTSWMAAATSTPWAVCSTRCWRASPPSPDAPPRRSWPGTPSIRCPACARCARPSPWPWTTPSAPPWPRCRPTASPPRAHSSAHSTKQRVPRQLHVQILDHVRGASSREWLPRSFWRLSSDW